MSKVILVRDIKRAKELVAEKQPIATAEAEYGSTVIEGQTATLAHHVQGWTSAPSLSENLNLNVQEDDYILVSHIDLDTVCGIMAVKGVYKYSPEVKKGINYVDCNGQHRMFSSEVSEEARRIILSYIGYTLNNRCPQEEDITEYVNTLILKFDTEENFSIGLKFVKGRTAVAESILVRAEGGAVLLHQPSEMNVFGLNSEYILGGVEYDYIVVFNEKFGSVTASSRLGSNGGLDMVAVMREIFGEGAGGHYGIAGTPRGTTFSIEDAKSVLNALAGK